MDATKTRTPAIEKITRAIYSNKRVIQLAIGIITLGFALVLLNLKVNSSPYFMAQTHESRIHELDIKELFSNSGEQILVVLEPKQGTALEHKSVEAVRALTSAFEALSLSELIDNDLLEHLRVNPESTQIISELSNTKDNQFDERFALLNRLKQTLKSEPVQSSALAKLEYLYFPVKKVRSYSTLENLTSKDDEIDLHPLLPAGELNEETLAQFKLEALENPLFKGLLLSEDTRATTIQIELTLPKDDNRNTGKLYQKVVSIVDAQAFEGEIYLAGNPVIDAEVSRSMQRDNLLFFPFVMLVISGVLYACFRRAAGIYVPLTIAGVTTIWTLGIMVALEIEQNIVTTILPVFLLTVAVADAVHFYSHYLHSSKAKLSRVGRLSNTFSHLLKPLLLTSITTLIGFLALAWTDIIFIKTFGLLMALGVVFALVITVLIAPVLVPDDVTAGSTDKPEGEVLNKAVTNLVSAVIAKPAITLIGLSLVGMASLYSLQFLKFDQENINNFDAETVLRSHNKAILKHYDGTIPIDIWIDTGKQGGIYDPTVINGIGKIEQYLESREGIGYVLSLNDFLKRMYNLLTDEGHRLPEGFDEQLVAQLILVYENERSQDIKNVIDDQHRHIRLIVLGEHDAASFWEPILADIEALTPTGTRLEINGYGKVMFSNIEEVIKTNITSTIIALVLIALVMIVLFKSLNLGVIGILPLVLTVTMNYAVMSLLGIPVDVGTTIIASIAFGIGIDYSIHYLSEIERQTTQTTDINEAILLASSKVGVPIVINSLTLAGGFLVLTLSDFLVIQFLGFCISLTMLLSALNALLLIPVMTRLTRRNIEKAEYRPSP